MELILPFSPRQQPWVLCLLQLINLNIWNLKLYAFICTFSLRSLKSLAIWHLYATYSFPKCPLLHSNYPQLVCEDRYPYHHLKALSYWFFSRERPSPTKGHLSTSEDIFVITEWCYWHLVNKARDTTFYNTQDSPLHKELPAPECC
jgi:hypothetical protein